MSNLTDFFPSGGGGGLTPKFEEFNASGTFTPSQALIDAGGYIDIFLVGGGAYRTSGNPLAGEVIPFKKMYLTSTNPISVTIGAGGPGSNTNGTASVFSGSAAGGIDVTAKGGLANQDGVIDMFNAGWRGSTSIAPGPGILGYGAGGATSQQGILQAKANSGQASMQSPGGSGYCLIKWVE